jgi:hypothetical protein
MTEVAARPRVCASRRRRHVRHAPRPLQVTERDARVIHRVFVSRLCLSQATFVFARTAAPDGGSDHWSRRLRLLYDAGFLTRLYLPTSRYLGGSQWPVYTVEPGIAAAAAAGGVPWRAVARTTKKALVARASAMRETLVELITTTSELAPEVVEAGLRANVDLALRLYSGERAHIQHALLAIPTAFSRPKPTNPNV